MAKKKKATGAKRPREKTATKTTKPKKKGGRFLTKAQVRDLKEKARLGMDQAMATLTPFELSMDFPVRGDDDKQRIADVAKAKQAEKRKGTRNDKRDAWIYDQAMKGVPWNTINNGIPKRFPEYDSFADHSGVIRAAKRYAERNGKPLPPLRR